MPTSLRSRGTSDNREMVNKSEASSSPSSSRMSELFREDRKNIAILLFLYLLQGLPLGLSGAIPFILTQRKVSYREQAEFSFSFWPFSLKLLWAPIVDSVFVARFGRRKTWLVLVQYLIGFTMLLLAKNVETYLEAPDIPTLTAMFFFLNFLAATQDIAVDGWALTMLHPENVGYASMCNSVGQTAGYFLGYVLYIGLESYGFVTLPGFLMFWSGVFFVSTTLVAIFKHEVDRAKKADDEVAEEDLGVMKTYQLLFSIMKLSLMPTMIIMLLTSKVGFSATDSVTSLKLVERGVPKEKLAMLSIPMMPLQIILPLIISRYTVGPRPMDVFVKAMPVRLIFGLIFALVVYVTPSFMQDDGTFPWYYFVLIVSIYALHQVALNCMFVSVMAFFSQISDPAVGGTYMTLLNTLTNLGGNWSATLALWLVDYLTVKQCFLGDVKSNSLPCEGKNSTCEAEGGTCKTVTEGYYTETVICVIFGFLWLYLWGRRTIMVLQDADITKWRVLKPERLLKSI